MILKKMPLQSQEHTDGCRMDQKNQKNGGKGASTNTCLSSLAFIPQRLVWNTVLRWTAKLRPNHCCITSFQISETLSSHIKEPKTSHCRPGSAIASQGNLNLFHSWHALKARHPHIDDLMQLGYSQHGDAFRHAT